MKTGKVREWTGARGSVGSENPQLAQLGVRQLPEIRRYTIAVEAPQVQ